MEGLNILTNLVTIWDPWMELEDVAEGCLSSGQAVTE